MSAERAQDRAGSDEKTNKGPLISDHLMHPSHSSTTRLTETAGEVKQSTAHIQGSEEAVQVQQEHCFALTAAHHLPDPPPLPHCLKATTTSEPSLSCAMPSQCRKGLLGQAKGGNQQGLGSG